MGSIAIPSGSGGRGKYEALITNRSVDSNSSIPLDVITLTKHYKAIVCIAGVACRSYTSPTFLSDNNDTKKISIDTNTYFANPSQWAFSSAATSDGTTLFSHSSTGKNDRSECGTMRSKIEILLGCNVGDSITLKINSQHGAKFTGNISVIGLI